MNKASIKLISPPQFEALKEHNVKQAEKYNYYAMPSLGMAVIVSALREQGYPVSPEDMCSAAESLKSIGSLYLYDYSQDISGMLTGDAIPPAVEKMVESLLSGRQWQNYGVIGFSVFSFGHFLFAALLAQKIKKNSAAVIVFGGAFVTMFGHLYPEIFDYVDFLIVGDGAEPFTRLLTCLQTEVSAENIPNLIFKQSGVLRKNVFQHYHLEQMPRPDFDGIELAYFSKNGKLTLPYQFSRGCFNKCNFCVRPPTEKEMQTRSPEEAVRQIRRLQEKYGDVVFSVSDSNIGFSRAYFQELLDRIIAADLNLSWWSYMDVRSANEQILEKIARSGCKALMYGVESGSDRVLRALGKPQTAAEAETALRLTKRAGIETTAFFIAGSPGETNADIALTREFIKRNRGCIDFAVVRKFALVYNSLAHQDPRCHQICNLRPQSFRYLFDFDECEGLAWPDKSKQQEQSKYEISKTIEKYL